MEKRKLNISFGKSGNGGRITRVTLPVTWIDKMGITKEDREIIATLTEDNKIIIEKNVKGD